MDEQTASRIVFCASDKIDEFPIERETLLGILVGSRRAFVSDRSSLNDFGLTQEKCAALEDLLGRPFTPQSGDRLWELAKELNARQPASNSRLRP